LNWNLNEKKVLVSVGQNGRFERFQSDFQVFDCRSNFGAWLMGESLGKIVPHRQLF